MVGLLKQLFTAKLVSYSNQTNVVDQIKQGLPVTFSLSIGAGIIWMGFGILVGSISAVKAGQVLGPRDHRPRADRHLAPVAWLGWCSAISSPASRER